MVHTDINPCSNDNAYDFDDDYVQPIAYDDTYGDDDDSQEDEEYMAYISLTVVGKLHKLSDDYCPEGLKSPSPATISSIESAANVNHDYVLSPIEYEGMPEIAAKYCKKAGAEAGGNGKSGKKDRGRGAGVKRKRGHNKN